MAAFSPGAVVVDVARRYDVCTTLIYKWRQEARAQAEPLAFTPVVVADDPSGRPTPGRVAAITVELGRGDRVSIEATASPVLVAATLQALRA